MKHVCVIALFLLYAVPVLLWPLEESLHPLPASLVEEGFEVAGRQLRVVRSTSGTSGSRKAATKSSVSAEHKGSSAAHHSGPTHSPTHHSQPKNSKKPKLNRPTKPGKKDMRRHHQQKKHKKSADTKVKQSEKHAVKPH